MYCADIIRCLIRIKHGEMGHSTKSQNISPIYRDIYTLVSPGPTTDSHLRHDESSVAPTQLHRSTGCNSARSVGERKEEGGRPGNRNRAPRPRRVSLVHLLAVVACTHLGDALWDSRSGHRSQPIRSQRMDEPRRARLQQEQRNQSPHFRI